MANVDILFRNYENDPENSIEVFVPERNPQSVYISIDNSGFTCGIMLDKWTAVRFVRELKKQIALIEE